MQWKGRRESENVEDRRGLSPAGTALAGGGIGAMLLILIATLLGGGNPLDAIKKAQRTQPGPAAPNPEEDELAGFVKVILADTEDVWSELLPEYYRKRYVKPKLVIFRGQVDSACGRAEAAVGPFYCPGDQQLYIDLAFYQDLKNQLGAGGDFAQAYVIAHEVGHHVQNLLGMTERVHRQRNRPDYNQLSVRLELQADYYAGVWAHHIQKKKNVLESGDIKEALVAANAIGDDRLQKQATGRVVPDSFTHGTSEQRVRWFRRGFESGDPTKGEELFTLDYREL